ncbi:YciI family protein [Luteimonas gilva]|uniref:YciI family protein n=1 Tax=Luteimonas gilva TaxID=2572684 RepID=A0A4U5JLC7_9GAMM|nr:YciI family protein [Luteimonas gilva]TKR30382.1 YciI family protein [Luteimonas gilva]
MKYLVLIYNDAEALAALDPDRAQTLTEACNAHADALRQNGRLLGAMRLPPASAATSLRIRNGRLLATDGPYAETKEQLGGFIVIEARDLNEAIRLVSAHPGAYNGCLEVRPLPTDAALGRAA